MDTAMSDFFTGIFRIMSLMQQTETLTGPVQGEQVCLKDSKYILFEILENQTGRAVQAPAGRESQIWQFQNSC